MRGKKTSIPINDLPDEFDWREKGAVIDIKNQGKCGASWAFTAIASLEGANFVANGKLLNLSERQLVDCSHECDPSKTVCNKGCSSGHYTLAYNYIITEGVEQEQDYPYTETPGSCKVDKTKIAASLRKYLSIENEVDQYKASLFKYGPIAVGIDGHRMKSYKGGTACPKCTDKISSAAVLVGYGSDGHWIIKNSMGKGWGEDGYYLLCKEGLICNQDPRATAVIATTEKSYKGFVCGITGSGSPYMYN